MNDETTQTATGAAMAQRARSRMAAKARLPWWYVAVAEVALLGLLFFNPVARLTQWAWMAPTSQLSQLPFWFMLFVLLLGFLVSRIRGADFRRTLMAYPSARLWGFLGLVVFVGGDVADLMLVGHGLPVAALLVAAVTVVATTALYARHYAAVRRDIRDGLVDPRWM